MITEEEIVKACNELRVIFEGSSKLKSGYHVVNIQQPLKGRKPVLRCIPIKTIEDLTVAVKERI